MSKYFDLNHGDTLPAFWTDAIQEYISTIAANVKLSVPAANQVRVQSSAASGQTGIGIDGLWRYNSADVTVTHPAGNAGIVHSIYVVASANTASLPNTDTTDYSFGVQILPGATTPTGTHNGRAITAYRKIGETDWDGTNVTGLRLLPGVAAGDMRPVTAIAPAANVPATVIRAAAAMVADIWRVEDSAAVAHVTIDAAGILTLRSAAAADVLFRGRVIGEANPRLEILADGSLNLGPGGATAPNVKLYHGGTDILKTDDTLQAVLDIVARLGAANQVQIGTVTSGAGIAIGNDGTRVEFIREAADIAQIPDKLHLVGELELDGALNHDGSTVGFYGVAPAARSAAYTASNVSTDRTYDANNTTVNELADVLGTLIADLKLTGLVG